ncbi:hypothetical protein AEAC466_17395 [Asticcacaulis sp. AC466]|uniref:hypothetical protein n=1 Tax=Asticcacaulis sp. AC466 TaxID=1282362 RepID=UPI0003C3B384|nr:hypothetical protein [Asticcacaulis sp. AC466]ESQ82398.1 hypothetical protein AEAC466_17395 [Asticcacaulis sp. AC466]
MTQITDRNIRPAFFYFVDIDPPVRFWTGMGPRHLAADAVDTTGGIYVGIDFNADLPSFNLLASGTADSLKVGLVGVDDRMIDLVDMDADLVEGKPVHIGFVQFDADWQIVRPPYWMKNYRITKVSFSLVTTGEPTSDDTHAAGVSVDLGYGDVMRKRGKGGYWTPDRAKPGDLGLSNVPGLDNNATRTWPPPGK